MVGRLVVLPLPVRRLAIWLCVGREGGEGLGEREPDTAETNRPLSGVDVVVRSPATDRRRRHIVKSRPEPYEFITPLYPCHFSTNYNDVNVVSKCGLLPSQLRHPIGGGTSHGEVVGVGGGLVQRVIVPVGLSLSFSVEYTMTILLC